MRAQPVSSVCHLDTLLPFRSREHGIQAKHTHTPPNQVVSPVALCASSTTPPEVPRNQECAIPPDSCNDGQHRIYMSIPCAFSSTPIPGTPIKLAGRTAGKSGSDGNGKMGTSRRRGRNGRGVDYEKRVSSKPTRTVLVRRGYALYRTLFALSRSCYSAGPIVTRRRNKRATINTALDNINGTSELKVKSHIRLSAH
ncbi:hypothetical protein BCR34DRAFT_638702 [Clohesyomyces aquaticus]|uniref:Uncharacterized protein n=1 Tax=Clohesyomyces aquaticus TaxID=1231657 RepID=A0A1Y2A147_9PLEO|nr:hypothetical protein BCR34DRAFT_638702 [Clohesyomyces aquaticus]